MWSLNATVPYFCRFMDHALDVAVFVVIVRVLCVKALLFSNDLVWHWFCHYAVLRHVKKLLWKWWVRVTKLQAACRRISWSTHTQHSTEDQNEGFGNCEIFVLLKGLTESGVSGKGFILMCSHTKYV